MPAQRASLTQTLTQKTVLSQQLRQSVELLQLTGPELQREIDTQLQANPLLQVDENSAAGFEFDPSDSDADHAAAPRETTERAPDVGLAADYREPNYLTWRGTSTETEDFDPYGNLSAAESLAEHLSSQLGCLHLSQAENLRCAWIIGNLNEQGFLAEPLEELARAYQQATGEEAEAAAWKTALKLVQSFEPAGIAAPGPTESLLIQISRSNAPDALRAAASELLTRMPAVLAKRDYRTAARTLGVTQETVEQAHELILSMNPHPASAFFDTHETGCVIAEVLLVKKPDGWKALLNPAVAVRLHFDEETYELLTKAKLEGKDLSQWRTRARDAKSFVRALEMRYSTITAVAQAIADLQEEFFTQGDRALKPMGLKDIAQRLNLAESTVSRAAAGKYVQSPAGTFELRHFFSSALTGKDGEAASAAAARRLIAEAVAAEDPAKPLSDAAIAELLAAQGIHLARRTVAKYREIEQIPPKSLRKRTN